MPRWIALLRAVNVGGKNKLPMAALRAALEGAGMANVRTYVQSGNVVADAKQRSAAAFGRAVAGVIAEGFGLEVPVVVRRPEELRAVLAWDPYPGLDPKQVHVHFLAQAPAATALGALEARDFAPDVFSVRGADVVVRYAGTSHDSPLGRALVTGALGEATARNWRTVQAVADLADA